MIWQAWFLLTISLFIVVVVFFAVTPGVNLLTDSVKDTVNIGHLATNTSLTKTLDYNSNIWNLWPIASIVVGFFVLFYLIDEGDNRYIRG